MSASGRVTAGVEMDDTSMDEKHPYICACNFVQKFVKELFHATTGAQNFVKLCHK